MTDAVKLSKIKSPLLFFSEVKTELAKVVWPSKEETVRLTGIVILISLITGLFIGALDYLLTMITGLIIK